MATPDYKAMQKAYFDNICADLKGGTIIEADWGPMDDPDAFPNDFSADERSWINTDPVIRINLRFPEPRQLKSGFLKDDELATELTVEFWQDDEGNGPGHPAFVGAMVVKKS